MKTFGKAAFAVLAFAAGTVYLTAPAAKSSRSKGFLGLYYAHRGLHDIRSGRPENSLAAFKEAKRLAYASELDVQLTLDGQVVVFHDNDLFRACGAKKRISELTYEELSEYRLFGTDEKIPLLSQVLEIYTGPEPLLVEIKTEKRIYELSQKTFGLLSKSSCPFCIESFDPRAVYWFKKNAPWVFRGQLTASSKELGGGIAGFLLSNLFTNCLTRPDFISHSTAKKSFFAVIPELLGAKKFVWTAKDSSYETSNHSVIFEDFTPKNARF